jgi:L-asparaginase
MTEDTCQPKLILHGGAGSVITDRVRAEAVEEALCELRDELYDELQAGATAREVVVEGSRRLEDDHHFNAGTGAVLQSDGSVRLSAALMDGAREAFSGVVNARELQNPIDLAEFLQDERDRVIAGDGTTALMRELDIPPYDPTTEKRFREWVRQRKDDFEADMAGVVSEDDPAHGTIGVVARDAGGDIAAATSTGGRGFERVGRVSDSAMPAGNYATGAAGVSCTGIGEDIIDACAAARIVVRRADGMPLRRALEETFDEAVDRDLGYGAVAIDADGHIGWGKTTEILLAAWHGGSRYGHTMKLAEDPVVESRANKRV